METILIIEDDELIRENMSELFSNEGYLVFTASDGKKGIQKARQIVPDLIFSDIMMPELDGFQVYKQLRENPQLSVIPFIFISALSDIKNIRTGMKLGADDYITKPFVNSELLDVVRNRIEKSKLVKKSMEQLKLNLILSVPHEFLTPLNAVLGFSQLLIDGCKEDNSLSNNDIQEFSEYIHSAGKKLLRLTQNYVLFTELTLLGENRSGYNSTGSDSVIEVPAVFGEFILEIASLHNREKDLQVSFEPAHLTITSKSFKKILEELLDNAIKFSNQNSTIIIYGIKEEEFYLICFQDHGKGMSVDDIKNVESFVQFDRNKLEQPGLGLGLALVIKLIDLSFGEFKIESTKGVGTKVFIRIPLAPNVEQ